MPGKQQGRWRRGSPLFLPLPNLLPPPLPCHLSRRRRHGCRPDPLGGQPDPRVWTSDLRVQSFPGARFHCGADEATLCWGCDAQVHGANFLVARHARTLLCRGCARPTPWRAAGPRLGPTASLCDRCVRRGGGGGPGGAGAAGAGGVGPDVEMGAAGSEDEDDDDEVVVEDEDEEEEGEGENQVVPWTEEADATPPPVASSTSSSSREAAANGANAAECAKEDVRCSTSPQPSLCQYSSPARHGGRSDEATSSRNGGRFLANRHRKRSPSDFLGSGSAQSGSGTPGRNCSNAGIGRNGFT